MVERDLLLRDLNRVYLVAVAQGDQERFRQYQILIKDYDKDYGLTHSVLVDAMPAYTPKPMEKPTPPPKARKHTQVTAKLCKYCGTALANPMWNFCDDCEPINKSITAEKRKRAK